MEHSVVSIMQCYGEVLDIKCEDLTLLGLHNVTPEELTQFLFATKWKKVKDPLGSAQIVADIMGASPARYMTYIQMQFLSSFD
ncbi:MAG: post-transcriptional regulator [Bacilli bacterium]